MQAQQTDTPYTEELMETPLTQKVHAILSALKVGLKDKGSKPQ